MIIKNQRGQSLIEYVILVALIGVATMGMVRLLQHTVKANLDGVINSLQAGHVAAPKYERVNKNDLRKSDFSNFWQGSRDNGQHGE